MDFTQQNDAQLNDFIEVIRKHKLDIETNIPDFVLATYITDSIQALKKYRLLSGGLAFSPPPIKT